MPDPRHPKSRRHPLPAMLSLIALGLLMGARARLSDPQVELLNALITAGSLPNKEATVRVILEKGGDYLIGTKQNTSNRLEGASRALDGSPFLT